MLDAVTLSALLHDKKVASTAEVAFIKNEGLRNEFDGQLRSLVGFEEDFSEYRQLFNKASAPWLSQIIDSHSQVLNIDGWSGDERLWKAFLKNGWKAKQDFTITEALTYGYSYVLVLPSEDPELAVIEPMSATNTFAVFANSWDIYPQFALQRINKEHYVYIDDEALYEFHSSPARIENLSVLEHGMGFCPVVRVDEQACVSTQNPVPPFKRAVTTAQSLTEARFHLSMIGRKASFPRLWATGVDFGDLTVNDQGAGDVLAVEEENAKFGAFPQADMNALINTVNSFLAQLAILTNTPPHMLPGTGTIANLSAEALASLEANYLRASERRKASMGQGLNDVFRTAGLVMGVPVTDDDSVHWDNMQVNSLAQLGDFIVKVRGTGADLEPLYQMIPGFDKAQAEASADHAYTHEKATNAAALIDLDIKRAELAKVFTDMGYEKEEALRMADYRL